MKFTVVFLLVFSINVSTAQSIIYADEKYGFNPSNSQSNFYNAIDGEKGTGNTLVFRDMGSPWYLVDEKRRFDVNDLTIVFEPGCVVEAKQGDWQSNERLLYILRANNLHIIGYGATFKMHKTDFPEGEYGHSIAISSANNISIKGLTLDGSGGDGLYIFDWNNSLIEDVDALGHKRQGISVISCNQLDVRNSRFRNTAGAAPEAGVDVEPNSYTNDILGCRFQNCSFTGNDYVGIVVALTYTDNRANPVDIEFSDCYTANNDIDPPYLTGAINSSGSGNITKNGTVNNAVEGLVTFKNIAIDGDPRGLWFNRKQHNGYKVVLENVVGVNLSNNESLPLIGFETPSYYFDSGNGGVDFNNVLVHTTKDVVPFFVRGTNSSAPGNYLGLQNVGGKITVVEPHGNTPQFVNYNPINNKNVTYAYSNQTSLPQTIVNIYSIDNVASKTGVIAKAIVTRNSSRIDYPLFVKYKVESTSVKQGDDIHYLTGAVIIEAGKTSAEIEIVARNNGLIEDSKNLSLSIEDRVLYQVGNESSVDISVVDDINSQVEESIWLEAECAAVGSNWGIVNDVSASGGSYLISPSGNQINSAPIDAPSLVTFAFNASAGIYKIYGRVLAPDGFSDSFWVRVNGGLWVKWNLIENSDNFLWDEVHHQPGSDSPEPRTFELVNGENILEFANREENTALDKIYITKMGEIPTAMGLEASNCIGDTDSPTVNTISAIDIGKNSFKVDWTVSEGSTGRVEWGLTSSLGNQTNLETGYLTRHIQLINGLSAGMEYFYRVIGQDEAGNGFESDIYSVVTLGTPSSDIWLEAECAIIGSNWNIVHEASSSEGKYLLPSGGNLNSPPSDSGSIITFNFNAIAGTYKIHGRVRATNGSSDSFWVRVNGGNWVKWNLIEHSTNFIWDEVHHQPGSETPEAISFNLLNGMNVLEFANREENTALDKIYVTKTGGGPNGLGETSSNCDNINAPSFVNTISVIDITRNSFKVDWTLNEACTGMVEWGLSSSLGNQTNLEEEHLTRHIQSVRGLNGGTEYYYRVIGQNEEGYNFVGNTYKITTLNSATSVKARINHIVLRPGQVSLYPNPTVNYVKIIGMEGQKEISVLDFTGKVLREETSKLLEPSLDLSIYAPGVYYINVKTKTEQKTFKVIKK
ncbi:right-handed parallel beta-helix repeat-containing protein [uncultured Zobellia sp.]|uniref:right-handed parallel beta-helix repeat-containing protein n=1 Tax=uncultured Zobellia sp. TaxID=255433 RepID=UPI002599F907|nr:right-handed parallel beta-helix repeat-containing protein [uncultured Zobellia sp.]